MNQKLGVQILLCMLNFVSKSLSLHDGLHPTPPMGWSSWNTFFGPGSEEIIMAQVIELIFLRILLMSISTNQHILYVTMIITGRFYKTSRSR